MVNRRQSLVLSGVVALAGVLPVPFTGGTGQGAAYAQSIQALPTGIISSQKELDSSQKQVVEQFIKTAMGQIINGTDPGSIARGRKSLQGQFGGGVSTPFILDYSRLIVDTVISTKAMDPTKALSQRLNTIIVLTNCVDPRMPDLISDALKDPSPAVRYWAAIAAKDFLDTALTDPAFKPMQLAGDKQQQTILKGLTSITNEPATGLIADHVLLALSDLTISDARSVVLARLNERVTIHSKQASSDLGADNAALTTFVVRLVDATPLSTEDMRELARLTYREMFLSLEMLDKSNLDSQQQYMATNMLVVSEKWLTWSYDSLSKSTGTVVVPNFKALVPLNAWGKIKLALIDFRDQKLMTPPVSLKADQVETEMIK